MDVTNPKYTALENNDKECSFGESIRTKFEYVIISGLKIMKVL